MLYIIKNALINRKRLARKQDVIRASVHSWWVSYHETFSLFHDPAQQVEKFSSHVYIIHYFSVEINISLQIEKIALQNEKCFRNSEKRREIKRFVY